MKISQVPISEFKARCLRMLDQVERDGSSLVITRRGKAIAKVVSVRPAARSLRGDWKGKVRITGDIVRFNAAEDWEAAR